MDFVILSIILGKVFTESYSYLQNLSYNILKEGFDLTHQLFQKMGEV